VQPGQIRAIRLRAGSNILNPLRYGVAASELEAKFSPAFMLASIALRRKAGIHEFTDAFVTSEPVQRMMRLVQTIFDPAIEAQGFDRIRSTVEVDLTDGRTLVRQAGETYRGGPDRPFTREELYEKFSDCATLVLSPSAVQAAFTLLESLASVSDVHHVIEALTPRPGSDAGPGAP
jgi:2-methylcitrate dehydratase PrpD